MIGITYDQLKFGLWDHVCNLSFQSISANTVATKIYSSLMKPI